MKKTKQQCFSSLKNQKKQLFNFYKVLWVSNKREAQKIINVLNDSTNEEFEFVEKNGILKTVKEQKVNITKTIL